MRLFSPTEVEITYRAFSLAPGKYSLSVATLVSFALKPEEAPELEVTVPPVWDIIKPAIQDYLVFDEGWPKLRGEYLVFGAGYPGMNTAQPVSVSVSVGPLTKRLAVFGDRYFTLGGGVSSPAQFKRMPITPKTAYGGLAYEPNPYGKGIEPIKDPTGQTVRPLPNIEVPEALITSSSSVPGVAGFWPLYPNMPQRSKLLGAFNSDWVKTRWPHLPMQTDFDFFQVAPADQRLGQGYWSGNERIVVQNMHPEYAVLTGSLPGVRARVFGAVLDPQGQRHIGETKSRLETVFLIPDALAGIALYRSVIEVDDPQAKDVMALYAELEYLDKPPSAAQDCIAKFESKFAPLTTNEATGDSREPIEPDAEKKHFDKLRDELATQRQRFVFHLSQSGMTEAQILATLKGNPQTRDLALTIEQTSGGLSGFFDQIEGLVKWAAGDESDSASTAEATLTDQVAARLARKEVLERQANGQDCRDFNLQQADLSGLDLSGMDFSGAALIGANFAGSLVRHANFDRAALAQANFSAADLSASSFIMAGLSSAKFHGANLTGVNLLGADCALACFTDAQLNGVDFSGGNFAGADLSHANLEEVCAHKADFTGANLSKTSLTLAKLVQANFAAADLSAAQLTRSICIGANFASAKLHQANFESADLSDSSADKGTQAMSANFRKACMKHASWIGVNFSGSTFDQMSASGANYSESVMSMVSMRQVTAKQASFDKAVVTDSDFSQSNWMESSFAYTKLTNTAFTRCNLYGANFLETDFKNVKMEEAYIARTILAERIGTNDI